MKSEFGLTPIFNTGIRSLNLRNINFVRPFYEDFWATFFVLILELFDQNKNEQQLYIIQKQIKPINSLGVNKSIDNLLEKVRYDQRDKTIFDIITNNDCNEMKKCFIKYIAESYNIELKFLAKIFQINLIIFNISQQELIVNINDNYTTLHLIKYSNIWFGLYKTHQTSLSMAKAIEQNQRTKCSYCNTKSENIYFARNCMHPYCEKCLNLKFRLREDSACNVCERSLRIVDFSIRLKNDTNSKERENYKCLVCYNQKNSQQLFTNICGHGYCCNCIKKNNINQKKCLKYDCQEEFIYQEGLKYFNIIDTISFLCIICQQPYFGVQKQFKCQNCKNTNCIIHQDLLSKCFCSCEQCGMRITAQKDQSRSCNTCNKVFCLVCKQFKENSIFIKNNYNEYSKKNSQSSSKFVDCSVCGGKQQESTLYMNLGCFHRYCLCCVEKNLNSFNCCIQGCKQDIIYQRIQEFYFEANKLKKDNTKSLKNCGYCENSFNQLGKDRDYIECNECQKLTCLNHLQLLEECQCRCKICLSEITQQGESCKFCNQCNQSFCGVCFEKVKDDDSANIKQNDVKLEGLCDCIISKDCNCDENLCGQCLTHLVGQKGIEDVKCCDKHKFCFICTFNSNQMNRLQCQICSGQIKKIKKVLLVEQEFIVQDHYKFKIKDFYV